MPSLPKLLNKKPHVEARIHRALEAQRKERSTHKPGIMLSSVGKCQRVLWAQLHGIEPDPERAPAGKALVIFAHGDAIEEHVIRLLRIAGFVVSDRDPATKQQYAVSEYDGKVRGRLDGILVEGRKNFGTEGVLEIKSAKRERFDLLVGVDGVAGLGYEEWSPEYADTLHAYMGWRKLSWALVVVYCKDDSRIYAEKIAFDPTRFLRLRLKVEHVIACGDMPPERPEEAASQYGAYCKWCDYNEWCWGPLAETRFDP